MNNQANNSCSLGEDILAYLYDELSPEGREKFEIHLENCFACIDEFAELSAARYSVYEWKNVEFAPLATPRIVVPIERKSVTASWLDSIKAAFAWNHAWTFAGGAAAVVLVAIVSLAMLRNGSEPVIATDIEEPRGTTVVPIPERIVPTPEVVVKTEDSTARRPDETEVAARPKAFEPTPRRTAKPRLVRRVQAETVAAQRQRVSPNRRLQNSPTLGQYVEDRDESLRLTDIFDDLDTKELD